MSVSTSFQLRKAGKLYQRGDIQGALGICATLIDNNSSDPRAFIQRGIITATSADFHYALKLAPSNKAALLHLCLSKCMEGDYPGARAIMADLDQNELENPFFKTLYSVIEYKTKDNVNALVTLAGSASYGHIGAQALILLETEKRIFSIKPDDPGANEEDDTLGGPIGKIFDLLDFFAMVTYRALSHIVNFARNINNQNSRKARGLMIEADYLDGMDNQKKAYQLCERSHRLEPENEEVMRALVALGLSLGKTDQADITLQQLEKMDEAGDDPFLALWRAEILFGAKEYKKAKEKFQASTSRFGRSYYVQYKIGLCASRCGDNSTAIEYFKTSLSTPNPGLIDGRLNKLAHLAR